MSVFFQVQSFSRMCLVDIWTVFGLVELSIQFLTEV